MKIELKKISIRNFKGINALTIDFMGSMNIYGDNASGKAQPLTAKVLTPKGFVNIGSLKVGDKIYSVDGKPTKVIGVYPQGVKPSYKVKLLDGRETESCDEHLWTVYTSRLNFKTITLKEMMEKGLKKSNGTAYKYFVPNAKPIEFAKTDVDLPVHPYVLGVLLGDGYIGEKSTIPQISTSEEDVIARVQRFLGNLYEIKKSSSHNYTWRVAYLGKSNPLMSCLTQLNLRKLSGEKFIPEQYLFSSIEQRKELLAGLFDSDGSIAPTGNYSFSTISRKLAINVMFLCRSLGYQCTIKSQNRHSKGIEYSVGIQTHDKIYRSDKHQKRYKVGQAKNASRYFKTAIKSIEYVGEKEMVCIMVEHPSHLYLTDDFIVTHNTTILDAFLWLLFDKNSSNESKFNIKPLDLNGEEMHRAEHEVEVIFDIDGLEKSFKKVYKEKWTQKRGTTEHEFSGHTTDYYVNDTPKSMGDYKKEVALLAEEEVFKMITNLYYFNTMDWKKRRDIVLKLAGDIDNAVVIASNPNLKPLESELTRKKLDEVLATSKATKAKTNKAIEAIPIKIQELQRSLAFDNPKTNEELKIELEEAQAGLKMANEKIAESDNSRLVTKLNSEIEVLNAQKKVLQSYVSTKSLNLSKITAEGSELKIKLSSAKSNLIQNQIELASAKERIKNFEEKKTKLYERYDEEEAKEFVAEACQYCGQALPQDKLDSLAKKFNLAKASMLENIVTDGKNINSSIKVQEKAVQSLEKDINSCTSTISELENAISSKYEEYKKESERVEVNPNQNEIEEIDSKILALRDKLSNTLNTNSDIDAKNFTFNVESLVFFQQRVQEINLALTQNQISENTKTRINELIAEEKALAKEYEVADKFQALCEEFITTKSNLLETRVNNQFDLVKFKLFEQQINGGITETCVATVDGVPFSDLNHAMQVNAGLDIIKALQKIYDITAPIFIDNAESVTKLKPIDTQIIRLVVSEADKKLRFENQF